MRLVQSSALALTLVFSVVVAGSCAGDDASTIANNGAGIGVPSGSQSGSTTTGPSVPPAMSATTPIVTPTTPTPVATPTPTPTAPATSNTPALGNSTMNSAAVPTTTPPPPAPTQTEDEEDDTPPVPTEPAATATDTPPPAEDCTDVAPDDRERCDANSSDPGPMMTIDPGTMPEEEMVEEETGELGDDNPYPAITNGQQGWGSRYWDCCKASCGWKGNASNPVISCDKSDNSLGVTDERNSCEANGQSGAFTCHSMAPWAYSTKVSYGFAAVNGVGCGTCFQLQFTGTSHNGGDDPGCAALNGKTMVIQATNIGGIEQNQFDLLIPGGGVGLLNGCAGQWGVDNAELGAQYGGFLPACKQAHAGDQPGVKQCMRDKCQSIFGSRNLTELYDGCMWFADWFEAADNPQFTFQQIDCPEELTSHSGAR